MTGSTVYFKHVFVYDVKAVPGKLFSLDFYDSPGHHRSQIMQLLKSSRMTCHSKLPGTALSKCFSGKKDIKLKKSDKDT